jgi:hypothetical protein
MTLYNLKEITFNFEFYYLTRTYSKNVFTALTLKPASIAKLCKNIEQAMVKSLDRT